MIALILIALLSLTLTANMKHFQFEQLNTKDDRLNKTVEAVSHLKIIKLHVWEEPFQAQVREIKKEFKKEFFKTIHLMFEYFLHVFLKGNICI